MGSAWDTYYDRDPSQDWCGTHGTYLINGCCGACRKEREDKKRIAREKASEILKQYGIEIEDLFY